MNTKLLILLLVSFQFCTAQQRTCGLEEKMEEMLSNPILREQYEVQIAKSQLELDRLENNSLRTSSPQTTFKIPVAVHYPDGLNVNRVCLVALAQSQIDILNADYNASNTDMSTWIYTTGAYFPGIVPGSIDIEFVLATQNHPVGFDANLLNGQPAVTIGYDFAQLSDYNSNWAGYLNIVVKALNNGVLGYAYLASSPANGSAVFISINAFGSGVGCVGHVPTGSFNLGRTLTHELGHYMNLHHIWGDASCGNDQVADTPQHNTSNLGCPNINHYSTCTGTPKELTMNYMDYSNDVCMYMFTSGQATRSLAHLNTIYSSFNQGTLFNDLIEKNNFSIYPNPNQGSFELKLSNFINNDYSVEILDNFGRVIYEKNFKLASGLVQNINVENASTGVYFVKFKSQDVVVTKKINIK
ncbi:zinc-dependent metalloprotease [uncultured Flavobacterium sp.]|uniref:zinc-dependent metalloprotease n=1 Tax=uncultured Flavobacterium sp. TaxID=165435 RepID=UPI0030CA29F6